MSWCNFLKVVTCGNVPLESSFQRVPRCVYTSTSLYEYRGWDSKAANPTHRRFTWGLRSLEVRKIFIFIYFEIAIPHCQIGCYKYSMPPFVQCCILLCPLLIHCLNKICHVYRHPPELSPFCWYGVM